MNTDWSTLSVRKALESSLPFLVEFVKKHWILVVLYAVSASLTGIIHGEQSLWEISLEQRMQLGLTFIVSAVVGYLMLYYGLSMAIEKLDPSAPVFKKGLPKSLWQIFCAGMVIGSVAMPLLLLFIIPMFWWLIKCSVANANLLSTDDGVIESIKKSHRLMDNRFWQSFGFLFATAFAVGIATMILMGSMALVLFFAGLFHSVSAGGGDMHRVGRIFGMIASAVSVFSTIIFYYLHAWLYVYLKNNQAANSIAVN